MKTVFTLCILYLIGISIYAGVFYEEPVKEPEVVVKEVIRERIKVINPCEQHNLKTASVKEVKYFNGEVRIGIICKKSG